MQLVYYSTLFHSGVKGMKWGIRRYQNPDGTLTSAGRLRYYKTDNGSIIKKSRATKKYEKKLAVLKKLPQNSILNTWKQDPIKSYLKQRKPMLKLLCKIPLQKIL